MSRPLRGVMISPFLRRRLVLLVPKERAVDHKRLTTLIEAGQVTPSLDRTYPLEDAPEGVRLLEEGRVRGKIAITA